MENILEIEGLCKTYDKFSLKDLTFSLPKGYIMGFVGKNGSGKTTTIRLILNMAKKDKGSISVFGLDNETQDIEIKQRIGVVFDSLYLAQQLNIKQIEKQIRPFYKNWSSEQFFSLIKKFDLPDNRTLETFSKGMKMKLMIAVALSHKAELLILDEPTSGIDPVVRDELLDILAEYIEDGKRSVLFSTHITTDVERIADYITILHNGKLWFTGTKDELSEKFMIIKGDEKEIPVEIKEKMIGYHSYRNGFEALIETKYLDGFSNILDTEKASIDEILIFIAKEDKNERHNKSDEI